MPYKKISTPPGPEDMVADLHHGAFRLLLSCTDRRRKADGLQNGIYALDPITENVTKLYPQNRTDYAGEIFSPHGIDLVKYSDGSIHLLVISHTKNVHNETRHEILDLRFNGADVLERVAVYNDHHLIHNPNDIAGLPDGRFYFTNSPDIEHFELASPEDSIIYYSKATGFKTVGFNLRFANGIAISGNQLVVSAVQDDKMIVSEIHNDTLIMDPQAIACGKGMDNISFENANTAWVPAHTSMGKYMMYAAAKTTGYDLLKSPGSVNKIDFAARTCEPVFTHNGAVISAVSTVVKHDETLYLSPIFDAFVVAVTPDENGTYKLEA